MSLESFLLIGQVRIALSVLIVILSFYKVKSKEPHLKLIGLLFFTSFICDLSSLIFGRLGLTGFINLPQSFYDVAFLLIIASIYNYVLKGKHRWMFIICFAVVAFSIFNFLFLQKENINSYNKFLISGFVLTYTVLYFYNLMVELPTVHIQRMPMFWFNSAFLIYHAGTFFLFAFTSYLINVLKDDLLFYWSFHNSLGIIQQIIILVGISYDFAKPKVLV